MTLNNQIIIERISGYITICSVEWHFLLYMRSDYTFMHICFCFHFFSNMKSIIKVHKKTVRLILQKVLQNTESEASHFLAVHLITLILRN